MVCDGLGRPLTFFLSPGQMSDARGAAALLSALPACLLQLWHGGAPVVSPLPARASPVLGDRVTTGSI
jgi:hypothetical protein